MALLEDRLRVAGAFACVAEVFVCMAGALLGVAEASVGTGVRGMRPVEIISLENTNQGRKVILQHLL